VEITVDPEAAITSHAAERYALGEMSDAEVGEFEKHFFDCRHCAQDVRDVVSFSDGARLVFREAADGTHDAKIRHVAARRARRVSLGSRLLAALPAAAAVFFLGVALYQALVVIPGLQRFARPAALPPTVLRVSRAAPSVVEVPEREAMFQLAVDVNAPEQADRYRAEFRSSSGKPVASLEAAATATGTLHLVLPAADFPAGEYTMTLETVPEEGGSGAVVEEYVFRVEVTGGSQEVE